jgi:hypothetical protein
LQAAEADNAVQDVLLDRFEIHGLDFVRGQFPIAIPTAKRIVHVKTAKESVASIHNLSRSQANA